MTTSPLAFRTAGDLDSWLLAHAASHPGLWIKVARKGSGIPSVSAADVNDVALCHGWITGQRKGLDDACFLQRITPRRRGSVWSQVNVRRVAELTAAGRMRPAGVAEAEAARADGRWSAAYASQKDAPMPDELSRALARAPRARQRFEALGRTDRYLLTLPVLRARTAAARTARAEAAVAGLTAPGG
ncbi:YdeI/OmpD-associated family protein [Streptomyces actuosus]|uniref:YdeI/OmpD-associated family protein n=1 Tax=Streptomyces actuosus TaxID=1885 RepID=A0ABS2VST0_STRAS|nr:YdeI/OmpD-associated family protein [Streptomyces actuosus]MBN0046179.1 YdeI/OmpD-associated family protein [Streptomyces actuosus]